MANKGLIGVQMSTIAPAKMPHFDAYESMGKLADIGYHCVEISQVPMTAENVAGFRKAIDELGLNVSSCTASTSPMLPGMPGEFLCNPDDYKKIVEDCRKLDCDMLRIGMLPMTCMGNYQKAVDFAKEANEYALKLKEDGIDLYYHNHHVEFVRYDGEFLLDIIRANAPALGFELDSHWMWRGGVDPVKYLHSFKGRVRMQHLKDYKVVLPDVNNFDMHVFGDVEHFAEVGEGMLDMPAIIEAGLESGSEYFMIEQDNTYGRDVYESLAISRDNLIKMGYGDWM